MGDSTKTDEFSEKLQTAFDPHPPPLRIVPFCGNHVHVFHANVMYVEEDVSNGDSCIFSAADRNQRLMTTMLLL